MFYGQTIPRVYKQIHRGQARDIDNGLVGHWTFDIDARDVSGNGNDGTVNGGAVRTRGVIRGAYKFDGSDDYIDCGDGASLAITDVLTFAAWVKVPYKSSARRAIVGRCTSGGTDLERIAWLAFIDTADRNGLVCWTISTGSSRINLYNSNTVVCDNTWHFVAGSFDGSFLKIYIDGEREGILSQTITPQNNGNTNIGREATDSFYIDGLISDVRVYHRALSPAEIRQLYQLGTNRIGLVYGEIFKPTAVTTSIKDIIGSGIIPFPR